MNAKKIEKEEIANLHFLPNDVLQNPGQIQERSKTLMYAAVLGNIEHEKCKIIFHTQEGNTYVETTIWAVTDKYICLKGGICLLIASILEVII